ncbi:BTAD domain-containing putative transcriptional regulator [Kribbella catacumbae]|uniref:BTAD domain-containing putative transcriptional regulator n=1 Tax=Kribbella catacumbae TaxID=460086 RepID=UPI0006873193|nr:BTAD domain-containing putative transcriptional regulator [Kribbella catacumbae]
MTELYGVVAGLHDAMEREDRVAIGRLLAGEAGRLVDGGEARLLVAVANRASELLGDPQVAAAVAMARLVTGDWHGATWEFGQLTSSSGPIDPGLSWRAGLAACLLGEFGAADRVLARSRTDTADLQNETIHAAWTATVCAVTGRHAKALELAEQATQLASKSASLRATSASHTVLSEVAANAGDWRRAESHYGVALDAAERSSDLLGLIRLGIGHGALLTAQGLAGDAIDELERTLDLIDRSGYVIFRPWVLKEIGDALVLRSEYDEASRRYSASRDAYQAMNSNDVARPLAGLGLIYRLRGQVAQARAAYEEAVRHAQAAGQQDVLALASVGLARVRAADDLEAAAAMAECVAALDSGPNQVGALLAKGWIALLRGEPAGAENDADRAAEAARLRRDQAGLAEALELLACARPDLAARQLADAIAIWTDLGNVLGATRARLLAAMLRADRPGALDEADKLRQLGVRREWTGIADGLAVARVAPALKIDALGKFQVVREGAVVAATEWQSKKARDVLKILLSRRGSPITRDELHSLLWPEDAHLASNRLSVVLTVLRTVLDGSRADRISNPAVVSDRNVVRLDLTVVDVDVERYIEVATAALESWRRQDSEALGSLQAAVSAYTGAFCAEDTFESWAQPMREELSALHASVLRALGAAARAAEEVDLAVWSFLALLRQDPYDESTYVDLVELLQASGRYGDARRQYRQYTEHMDEIDVRPTPFPAGTSAGSDPRRRTAVAAG